MLHIIHINSCITPTKTGTFVDVALLILLFNFCWKTKIPDPLQELPSATDIVELSICTDVEAFDPPLVKGCPGLIDVVSVWAITCGIFVASTHVKLLAEVVASVIDFIEATWPARVFNWPWALDKIWNNYY